MELLCETFPVLRRIQRDVITSAHSPSRKLLVILDTF